MCFYGMFSVIYIEFECIFRLGYNFKARDIQMGMCYVSRAIISVLLFILVIPFTDTLETGFLMDSLFAGQYCIYKVGTTCPSGFKEGSLHWDDNVDIQYTVLDHPVQTTTGEI